MNGPERLKPRVPEAPNCVTIFGGGIAGLTAAHELVERGFRVQLWEPRSDQRRSAQGLELGGMARTQWASVPWAADNQIKHVTEPPPWSLRGTRPITELPQKLFATVKPASPTDGSPPPRDPVQEVQLSGALGARGETAVPLVLAELRDELLDRPWISELYCEFLDRYVREKRQTRTPEERKLIAEKVRALVNDYLQQIPEKNDHQIILSKVTDGLPYPETMRTQLVVKKGNKTVRVIRVRIVSIDDFPDGVPADKHLVIGFRARERWIPGEHGFRFFPSFYYHVFDTMNRTPLLESIGKVFLSASQERAMTVNANPARYVEIGRTVYDNLRSTEKLAIAFQGDKWPAELSRSVPKSFEELYQWIKVSFEGMVGGKAQGLGFTPRDSTLFILKIAQYLTSGPMRRAEYEQMTWLDFLSGKDAYSEAFVDVISVWPEALIALKGNEVDARTQGNVLCQLFLDNVRPTAYRDGTLNGPTSDAWFRHWKRYLEAQGVEFIHGRIDTFREIENPQGEHVTWPQVTCFEPRYPRPDGEPLLMPGYFVLALPAKEAKRIAATYRDVGGDNEDLLTLAEQQDFGEGNDLAQPRPEGQLRHMVGVQLYFDEDISWLDGHAYFPGSPWGLSSISQVRFWQERHDWEHGYRGVLSVILSIFDAPDVGMQAPKRAWECSPSEIAYRVWNQIALPIPNIPAPRYWHVDQDFVYKGASDQVYAPFDGANYANLSPYQINLSGYWSHRPGDLEAEASKRYSAADGVVCAGTHMKTFTRLTTMEAANESARHAVNAILGEAKVGTRKSPCAIWPLEEREVADLKLLKDIDDELYTRGLAHFLEILGIDDFVANALREDVGSLFRSIPALEHFWNMLAGDRPGVAIHPSP